MLEQNKVPVQFRGLETKLDPKQAVIGDAFILENVRFDAPPKFQKRYGFSHLAKASAGAQLATFKDELLIGTGTRLLSRSASGLIDKGPLCAIGVTSRSVGRSGYSNMPNISAVASNGVSVHFWTETVSSYGSTSSLKYRWAAVDVSTGQRIASLTPTIGGSGAWPQLLVAAGQYILGFGWDIVGGSFYRWALDTTNPLAGWSSPVVVDTAVTGGFNCDVTVIGGVAYLVYVNATGLILRTVTGTTISGATTLIAGYALGAPMTIVPSGASNFWIAYRTTGGGSTSVYAARFTLAGAQTLAPTLIVSSFTGIAATGVGLTAVDTTGSLLTVFAEIEPTVTTPSLRVMTITSAGTGNFPDSGLGAGVYLRGLRLAAKAFAVNGSYYLPTWYSSTLQSTYFVLTGANADVAAKMAAGQATSPWRTLLADPSLSLYGSTRFVQLGQVERVTSASGQVLTQPGAQLFGFDFSAQPVSQEMGDSLFLSGGICSAYDGKIVHEQGFHLYPEGITVTPGSYTPAASPNWSSQTPHATGGFLSPGTYYFRVAAFGSDGTETYASPEVSVVISAGASTGSIDLAWTPVGGGTGYKVYRGMATGLYDKSFLSASYGTTDTGALAYSPVESNRPVLPSSSLASYQTCATYEWMDAQGVVHQSAPSPVVTVQASEFTPTFVTTVPTLRITAKQAHDGTNAPMVVVWRTGPNASVFFRVTPSVPVASGGGVTYYGSAGYPLYNSMILDSVSYTEGGNIPTTNNLYLASLPQLVFNPTNSLAEVPPLPCDPPAYVTRYKNRVVQIPSESPAQVVFSKEAVPGVPIEFNPQQFFIPVQGGAATLNCAAEMDDKLILFTDDRIYYTMGSGPAPNGTSNDYATPIRIPSDVGCYNPRSLVLTPEGLIFQSLKGIYLLGRDLSVQYFGAPIDGLGGTPITSSNTLNDSQRVVFTLNNGTALVYDSFVKQWALWTNYNAADALIFGGRLTHVRPDGSIKQEQAGLFTDDENGSYAPIYIRFQTTWLSFAGLAGYQRVWRFIITGDYKSAHTLLVSLAFDDAVTPAQTISFDAGAYYGPLNPKPPYELQVKVKQQKCSRVQVTITETEPGGSYGEGFSLSNLHFLVGQEPGLSKPALARTIS